MKKVTFTVDQLVLLHKMRPIYGFSYQRFLQFLDDAEHDCSKSTIELSDKEVTDIAESLKCHIDRGGLSDKDLATAYSLFESIGAAPF